MAAWSLPAWPIRCPERIRRLIYWNAFVPNNGESLNDMVPPPYVALFDAVAAQRGDGSVVLPFPIWREAFINDADLAAAQKAYDILNPHPLKTFSDKISLKTNPADMQIAKSYINCTEDTSLPHHYPWHPRLSQKLGLFRLVQVPGSHELCFLKSEALGAGDHGGRTRLIRQGATTMRAAVRRPHANATPARGDRQWISVISR